VPETITAGAWALEPLPIEDARVRAVAGSSATDVWAVGEQGIFHYDGSGWTDATPSGFRASRRALRSVSVLSKDDAWAVGDAGTVAHFDGKTWTITQPPIAKGLDLQRVVAWPGEVVALATFGNGLFRFDGTTWTRLPWPEHVTADDFWGTSSRDLWVPGLRSAHHFDGAKWDEIAFGMFDDMYAVSGSGPNDVWMVGTSGTRGGGGRARHFDGTAWKDVELPRTSSLHAVSAPSPKEAYAVGLLDSIVTWDGAAWHTYALPEKASGSYKSVYSPGDGVFFASAPESRYVLHKKAVVTASAEDAGPR
jgi:hypothetical protein